MIDTNTRHLKRGSDNFYRTGTGKKICSHCGLNQTCEILVDGFDVLRCDEFLPALPFQDETGLDRLSNTVRIGLAWTQRLKVGQQIALYNPKKKLIFGHSTVLRMFSGPIIEMLAKHARWNHLMLDTPPEEAAETLFKWQRQNYGPRIINDATKITAVYLQRDPVANAAADGGGVEAVRPLEGGAASPR